MMKKLLGIVVLCLLWCNVSYAGLVYGKETLPIVTKPEGVDCTFENNKGKWKVITPGLVKLKLSKKSLNVTCKKNGYKIKNLTLNVRDKDNLVNALTNLEGIEISTEEWIEGGIWDAILQNPGNTLANIVWKVGEFTSKTGAKIIKLVKDPVTYATHTVPSKKIRMYAQEKHYEIKKKLQEDGHIAFIFIELEKK